MEQSKNHVNTKPNSLRNSPLIYLMLTVRRSVARGSHGQTRRTVRTLFLSARLCSMRLSVSPKSLITRNARLAGLADLRL